jgi:hypothetical protein
VLPLAAAGGFVVVIVVIVLAIALLVVLFRADDRDQVEEDVEAEARRPLP